MTFGNNSLFPFNYINNNELNNINKFDKCLPNNIEIDNVPNEIITEQAIKFA